MEKNPTAHLDAALKRCDGKVRRKGEPGSEVTPVAGRAGPGKGDKAPAPAKPSNSGRPAGRVEERGGGLDGLDGGEVGLGRHGVGGRVGGGEVGLGRHGEGGRVGGAGSRGDQGVQEGSAKGGAAGGGLQLSEHDSAASLESLGMARLTRELTNRGLKCGGSMRDRAERLWLLRSTAWDKIKPKNWSSQAKRCLSLAEAAVGKPEAITVEGHLVLADRASGKVFHGTRLSNQGKLLAVGSIDGSSGAVTLKEPLAAPSGSGRGEQKKVASGEGGGAPEEPAFEFPFQVDDDDHCESPPEAYEDVAPVLDAIAAQLGKDRTSLRIYDPFFCQGAVVRNLGQLGFTQVYNRCEDFYQVVREKRTPEFDVLLTNPPYSQDHLARTVQFCVGCGKPWMLLVPNYVYAKDYYDRATAGEQPMYVVPRKRYHYWTPKALKRGKHTHSGTLGERTSPFVSFWHMGMKGHRAAVIKAFGAAPRGQERCTLARDRRAIPPGVMDVNDPHRRTAKNAAKRRSLQWGGADHRAEPGSRPPLPVE